MCHPTSCLWQEEEKKKQAKKKTSLLILNDNFVLNI